MLLPVGPLLANNCRSGMVITAEGARNAATAVSTFPPPAKPSHLHAKHTF